jgi:c-di-GMP-binding flagellar brake protein YcgR
MGARAPAKRVQPSAKEPIAIQLITDGFEARDISATGAGIFVPPHLEGCNLKSPVNLVITLPEADPFRARGRIVHRTKMGREFLGVEFMNLSQAHVATITRYVEGRLSGSRRSGHAELPARTELKVTGTR